MLETHLQSPVTRRRLRAGPAADHIDGFADWLHRCGYAPTTIDGMLRCLAGWTDWMLASGFGAQELLSGFEACRVALQEKRRVSYSRGANRQSLTAASVFIRFLQQQGKLPPPVIPSCASELWPVLGEFRAWMLKHRGLTEATLDIYQRTLVGLCTALGDDAHAYSAETLRAFVLDRARPHGIQSAKSITVAVRSFLRFLGATGQCPPGMEHAIPGFACRQLSAVPRFLIAEDVERVIGCCSEDAHGSRDRAVLLLLADSGCAPVRSLSSNSPTSPGATGVLPSAGRDVAKSHSLCRRRSATRFCSI